MVVVRIYRNIMVLIKKTIENWIKRDKDQGNQLNDIDHKRDRPQKILIIKKDIKYKKIPRIHKGTTRKKVTLKIMIIMII